MAKIKIGDLPQDLEINEEKLRQIHGGTLPIPIPRPVYTIPYSHSPRRVSYRNLGALPIPIPRPY